MQQKSESQFESPLAPIPVQHVGEFFLTKDGQKIVCNEQIFQVTKVTTVEEFVTEFPDRFGLIYYNKFYVKSED